jgi:hypothetical protein
MSQFVGSLSLAPDAPCSFTANSRISRIAGQALGFAMPS